MVQFSASSRNFSVRYTLLLFFENDRYSQYELNYAPYVVVKGLLWEKNDDFWVNFCMKKCVIFRNS